MYKLKHAFKGIFKDKVHSVLNVTCFVIGLVCSIIVFLYVQNILTYDKHHLKHKRIYQYGVNMTIGDVNSTQVGCNIGVGPLLKEYIKGIEDFVRIRTFGEMLVKRDDVSFKEDQFVFMDSSTFNVFTYDFVYGKPQQSLKNPNQIVLTESISKKYFDEANPIGEFLEIEQYGNFEVVGVIKDLPENTIITFEAILSFSSLIQGSNENEIYSPRRFTGGMSYRLFFLLKPDYTEEEFLNEFQSFYDEFMAEYDGLKYKSVIEPISDVYLNSKIWDDWAKRNRKFLYGFISLGVFILLLASINYINIASSTAISRTKEVSIKKVVGSSKLQLIIQILSESVILCILSLIIAFAFTEFILIFTPFNDLIGAELKIEYSNVLLISSSILIALIVGLLSGLFPALFLAGISPSKTLYGKSNGKIDRKIIRNALISIQLIISIVAIILSLLMKNQINFVLNKDLGFNKENVIVLQINEEEIRNKIQMFRNELIQYHGIESISFSSASPGYSHIGYAFNWESNDGDMQNHAFRQLTVDMDYFATLGIELMNGIGIENERIESDSIIEFVVNESLVKTLGWDNPIGKRNEYGVVVGVVKDYNYGSLHGEISPMYIYQSSRRSNLLNIKLNGNDIEGSIKYIEGLWQKNLPDYEFSYTFIDDQIAFFYTNDIKQQKLGNIFSVLCIIISVLGLFSMVSLANARKIKEVAIRKVHGATVSQILLILYKNIFYLVCIASVVAIPIVYKIYSKWILTYTYKTKLSILAFIISFAGVLVVSFIISVTYSIKVARSNPVDSLRYE